MELDQSQARQLYLHTRDSLGTAALDIHQDPEVKSEYE